MFFAAYPKQTKTDYCIRCYENAEFIGGVIIDDSGITQAWLCNNCNSYEMLNDTNPFNDINNKLDKILRRFGFDIYC